MPPGTCHARRLCERPHSFVRCKKFHIGSAAQRRLSQRERVQLHSLEGPNLASAAARWERRNGSSDGIVANVQTTLYAAHKGRIKVVLSRSEQLNGSRLVSVVTTLRLVRSSFAVTSRNRTPSAHELQAFEVTFRYKAACDKW